MAMVLLKEKAGMTHEEIARLLNQSSKLEVKKQYSDLIEIFIRGRILKGYMVL